MIADAMKAVAQIGDPRFRRVFLISIALTVALLALFYWGFTFLVAMIPPLEFGIFGYRVTFIDDALSWLAYGAGLLLTAVLMFPVAAVFIGMFLEDIADAVEDRHYPDLPPAGRMSWWDTFTDGLLFLGTMIVANLLGLVLYLLSGPLAPFVFLAVNGYLLGRQYFELVAARRLGIVEARKLRRSHTARIWAAGVLMAAPLSVPILNILVPVIGVASFTHLYHRVRGRAG